jgi:hypothetical protein
MSPSLALLADAEESSEQLLLLRNVGHTGWSQTSIIFGSLMAVAVLAFGFVYLFRKKLLRRHRHHHHRHITAPDSATNSRTTEQSAKKKKKWRRSGHPRRQLNPTLAQTRGLPPLRGENTPPPPAP